jgi:YegS/Rv2252/BmrU family lipid kinase
MYIFVLNPISGKHNPRETKRIICTAMKKHNKKHIFIETTKDGSHIADILKYKNREFTTFVGVGGDGTMSELVNILKGTNPRMGIIPTGSANSLARELSIPLTIPEAAELIATSKNLFELGILSIGEKYFVLDVSVGINAMVMKDTKRHEKRIWGWMAYMKHALRWLFTFHSKRFTVSIDGIEKKYRATDVIVANGGIVKTVLKRIAGETDLRTHFDVLITKTRSHHDYLRYIFSFILGPLSKDNRIEIIRARKRVTIDCTNELPVQGDGDVICKTPVTIDIHPKEVRVIVPPETQ